MPKVICTLPNASNSINGHDFEDHPDGKISADLPEEVAANFATIDGYKIADEAHAEKHPAEKPHSRKKESEEKPKE